MAGMTGRNWWGERRWGARSVAISTPSTFGALFCARARAMGRDFAVGGVAGRMWESHRWCGFSNCNSAIPCAMKYISLQIAEK